MSQECCVFDDVASKALRPRGGALLHAFRLCRIAKALGRPCKHEACQKHYDYETNTKTKRKEHRTKFGGDIVRKHLDMRIGETLYVCAAAAMAATNGLGPRYRKLPLHSEVTPDRANLPVAAALLPCYHKFTMPRSRKREKKSKKSDKSKKRPTSVIGMFTLDPGNKYLCCCCGQHA